MVAAFAGAIGDALRGSGQEAFNAATLLVAAAMQGWHNIWMARHGREMAGGMQALGRTVSEGSRSLLAVAVGVAILREESEVVPFLYGLAAGNEGGMAAQAAGLIQADLLPSWGAAVWDNSAGLDENSIVGRALHALVGYADHPAGTQLAAYAAVRAALPVAGRAATPQAASRPAVAPRRKGMPYRV